MLTLTADSDIPQIRAASITLDPCSLTWRIAQRAFGDKRVNSRSISIALSAFLLLIAIGHGLRPDIAERLRQPVYAEVPRQNHQ